MVPGDTFLKKSVYARRAKILKMCDSPLHAFPIGFTKNGKREYKICSGDTQYIIQDANGNWQAIHGDPRMFRPVQSESDRISDFIDIPCGKCLACKLEKAAEWANRCMLELDYHDVASYVTLTYNDDNVTYGSYTDPDTGEINYSRTLVKKDLQDFWKRLRKRYPDADIRYYACGEYGANERPHYHAIIFSYRPFDLQPWQQNEQGDWLYVSQELSDIWSHGFVTIGDVTHQTCNYVARYVTKKVYGDLADEEYLKQGRIPPFTTMSLKPAIGLRWFEDHPECVKTPISLKLPDKGITFNAPRYFRKKYEEKFSDDFEYFLTQDKKSDIIHSQDNFKFYQNTALAADQAEAKKRKREAIGKVFKRNGV